MLTIEDTQQPSPRVPALWQLGFRPFFIAAGLASVVMMIAWVWVYPNQWHSPVMTPSYWHAHAMVFGYAAAVIVGFVLTAAKNWTGLQTLYGWPLRGLFLLWLVARFLPVIPEAYLAYYGVLDVAFLVIAAVAVAVSVVRVKQWQQIPVIAKVVVLAIAHGVFYWGLVQAWPEAMRLGLYLGFYTVISLILMMIRRLIPFFIERGISSQGVRLYNNKGIDIASLVLFVVYMVLELSFAGHWVSVAAALLAAVHLARMVFWYHPQLWHKPLLWSLYIAYGFFVIGFVLKALAAVVSLPPMVAEHSYALGIGMVTISMMSRVSLGHTGRNVLEPPKMLGVAFALIVVAFILRVGLLIVFPAYYMFWISGAQFFWIMAFAIFLWVYVPMLLRPRLDGQFG